MKITHLIFGFNVGGAESMLVDILNEQEQLGHDVTLVVINDSYTESMLSKINSKVKLVLLGRKPASCNPWAIIKLNWFLFCNKPDAIHLHNERISKLLFTRCAKYLTVHALGIELSSACDKLKELFAISESVKKDVELRYPNRYFIKTIPNGICLNKISRKQNYGFANNIMRIVQVASLVSDIKGQDLLIDALGLLNERGIYRIEVDFIGQGRDLNYLLQKTKELGLENSINFLGLCDREFIYKHLKDYDLMCHPSRFEGFGLTVAEGIAAGLPTLVPDSDGPYEIILHGQLGYTFKKGDSLSLANVLQDIYTHYQERVERVVEPAYRHVKYNYSLKHMVEQYIEEYQKIIK